MGDQDSAPIQNRLLAGAIDAIPMSVVAGAAFGYVADLATPVTSYVFAAVAILAALSCFVNSVVLPAIFGRTVGCRAARIRIVPTDRVREKGIGPVAAVVRASVMGGLSWLFLLGYAWYWIDSRNRMWHDVASATMVVRAGSPQPPPFVARSFARPVAALVASVLGYLVKLPIMVLVAGQFLFLVIAPSMVTANLDFRYSKTLPADFPGEIVIPEEGSITDVASAYYPSGAKKVIVTWQDLKGEPVSVLLAWKLGLDILGFETEVKYTSTGSRVVFSRDGDSPIVGSVAAFPTDDEKSTKSMTLEIDYRGSGAATAATGTAR